MPFTFLKKKNNAKSTLNGAITNVATSLVVTSAASFPAVSFMATIWDKVTYPDPSDDPNMEIVKVTGIASTTFTVTRAQESTSGVAHSSGHAIEHLLTLSQLTEYETQINNNNPFVDAVIYFGDSATDGSWRITTSGNNLSVQRRESGVWNEKSAFTP